MNSTKWYWKNRRKAIKSVIKRRSKRVQDGYCGCCPAKREDASKNLCNSCLAKRAKEQKKLRQEKRDLNICLRCDKDAKEGFNLCEEHLKKGREYHRRTKANGNPRSNELS